jgi:TRAP-type uncharacterized transport system fused permease subunit
VALSAFAAATISGASPMKTGVQAMKLGVAKYILPFIFILSPALILRGTASESWQIIPATLIGIIIISGALEGYFWRLGNLTTVSRVLFFFSGLFVAVPYPVQMPLAIPVLELKFIGIAVFVVLFVLAYLLRGRSPLAKLLLQET